MNRMEGLRNSRMDGMIDLLRSLPTPHNSKDNSINSHCKIAMRLKVIGSRDHLKLYLLGTRAMIRTHKHLYHDRCGHMCKPRMHRDITRTHTRLAAP